MIEYIEIQWRDGSMFSKREYEYVMEIAKEGSFSKAAQKLYISQPALSGAIKKI